MASQARADLKERLERRAELAVAKIKNAETQAMADVKARAVDLAAKAAEQILRGPTYRAPTTTPWSKPESPKWARF